MDEIAVTLYLKTNDSKLLKELIESNGCNLPGVGESLFHGSDVVAFVDWLEIRDVPEKVYSGLIDYLKLPDKYKKLDTQEKVYLAALEDFGPIEALKVIRRIFGLTLKEAKEISLKAPK